MTVRDQPTREENRIGAMSHPSWRSAGSRHATPPRHAPSRSRNPQARSRRPAPAPATTPIARPRMPQSRLNSSRPAITTSLFSVSPAAGSANRLADCRSRAISAARPASARVGIMSRTSRPASAVVSAESKDEAQAASRGARIMPAPATTISVTARMTPTEPASRHAAASPSRSRRSANRGRNGSRSCRGNSAIGKTMLPEASV